MNRVMMRRLEAIKGFIAWREFRMRTDHVVIEEGMDRKVQEALALLRETPERSPEAIFKGEARFRRELDTLFPAESTPVRLESTDFWASLQRLKARLTIIYLASQRLVTILAIIILILGLLFSGVSVTALAAKSAIPGDTLYGMKTGLEQAHLAVTSNPAAQVNLYLELAEHRLAEIQALVERGKYDEVLPLAEEFQGYIKKASQAVNKLAQSDPERATASNARIITALSRFSMVLSQITTQAPSSLVPSLQPAIDSTRDIPYLTPIQNRHEDTNGGVNEDVDEANPGSKDEEEANPSDGDKEDSTPGGEDTNEGGGEKDIRPGDEDMNEGGGENDGHPGEEYTNEGGEKDLNPGRHQEGNRTRPIRISKRTRYSERDFDPIK
jgi:hypothetical protein